ncbi:MAG: mechanosensitive ion channel, partial [Nitrospirota bacterium]|nr:mechanosensitive ion channel [Nitrospirota bacterium]
LAKTVYWLIFLLFLPAILGALALEGLLDPVKNMVDTLLGFLPNLFAAGVILGVGWFFARIVQRLVTNVLAGIGLDQLGVRIGVTEVIGNRTLSSVLGLIVYVLIFIPIVVASLQALELEAITQPASQMLGTIIGVVPDMFGAALMIGIAYMVGKIMSGLATNVLTGIGFNSLLVRLGLPQEAASGLITPSHVAGTLMLVAILLFASIEAAEILGLQLLAELLSKFTEFGGHLLLGLIIIGIGLYLANLAGLAIRSSKIGQAMLLATGARIAIIVLTTAMALRQMGLADDIVNLAFGLTLGALAIAFALAIGLGGREIAAAELRTLVDSLKSKRSS